MKFTAMLCAIVLMLGLEACEKDCVCSGALQTNFCLTANGAKSLPDSLTFVRESEGKPNSFDTLKTGQGNCFLEFPGKHRVLVYSRDSLVFQSDWIVLDAEGCCNHAKDTTIDLPL